MTEWQWKNVIVLVYIKGRVCVSFCFQIGKQYKNWMPNLKKRESSQEKWLVLGKIVFGLGILCTWDSLSEYAPAQRAWCNELLK